MLEVLKKTEMKKYSVSNLLFVVIGFFLLSACGYKPSSHAISNIFEDAVYVEVIVDKVEPENAPAIKDELNRMVYTRFKGHIVPKEQAKSRLRVTYGGSTFSPLTYEKGYITRYRTNVKVKFDMETKQGKMSKTIRAVHEADIQASSLQSATLRTEAIGKGVRKALDEFLAYVSAKGVQSVER